MAQEAGDGSVVRVRMQRGALGDLGLPVNEERANEWIQVDLFVGQDGQPQAVRLPAIAVASAFWRAVALCRRRIR